MPEFLFKRDVIPGHPNHFTITATQTGTFAGTAASCAAFYHGRIVVTVKAVISQQFQAYMAAQQAQSPSGSTQ